MENPDSNYADFQQYFGIVLDDGRWRWKSGWFKRLAYQYLYRGCMFPFDDPCDDCTHWVGGRFI